MVIDLHVHTVLGSGDSVILPQDVEPYARQAGLDGLCITEHGKRRPPGLAELARRTGLLILAGLEVSTELGDVLVFGVEMVPPTLLKAAELRRYVAEAGGFMIAAHPFRGLWPRLHGELTLERACQWPLLRFVDAVEVANGWATDGDGTLAQEVALRLGLPGTGGSDAHAPHEIGCCVTIFDGPIRSEAELVAALVGGRFHAEDRRPGGGKGL